MLRISIFAAFVISLALSGAGQARAGADVEQVYAFYCAQCHGADGKGDGANVTEDFPVTPRNFNKADEMGKLTDADIKNVIREGGPVASKSPMMPPWGKTLSEEVIEALAKKLRAMCKCTGPS